jgi:VWFA-related protein
MPERRQARRTVPANPEATESIVPSMARRVRLSLLPVWMICGGAACWLMASETTSSRAVHEESQVTLVQVPVWVTDHAGKPIRGLQASDFEIEDEGVRQRIDAMDFVDLAQNKTIAGGQLGQTILSGRRHFLLLFDLSYGTAAEVLRAQSAAERFLSEGMAPDDLAAVATISAEKGASLLVTFTADRRQLVAAIRSLGLPGTIAPAADPLAFAFAVPGDPNLAKIFVGETTNPRGNAELNATLKVLSMTARRSTDEYASGLIGSHLKGMSALAAALDLVAGRKIVVFFSEGFDGRLLVGNRHQAPEEAISETDAMAVGQFWQIDVDKRYANSPLQKQLQETASLFQRSDCVVYAIDIGGLQAPARDAQMGDLRHGEEGLFMLAAATGGELVANANDLDASLRRLAERTSATYVLSFRPSRTTGDGAFHHLRVRVVRSGAKVSARSGYYEGRKFNRWSPLERMLSAGQLVSGEQDGTLDMRLLALPLRERSIGRVSVVLEVPGAQLAAKDGTVPRLSLYVYAVNERQEVEDFFFRRLTLDQGKDAAALSTSLVRYNSALKLLPGRYRIRALVLEESNGRFGLRAETVVVSDSSAGPVALTPTFVSSGDSGISMRAPREEGPDSGEPFELAGKPFVPDLLPDLSPEAPARVCLMLYPPHRDEKEEYALEAKIWDGKGRSFAPSGFRLLGRSAPDTEGMVNILADFKPGNLAPGEYALSVNFSGQQNTDRSTAPRASFRIRPSGSRAEARPHD